MGIILLVALALLSSLELLKETVISNSIGTEFQNVTQNEQRFEAAKLALPHRGVVGYMSTRNPAVLDSDDVDLYVPDKANYRLAQYALAPLILQPATATALGQLSIVIVDNAGGPFPTRRSRRQIIPPGDFRLLEELHNGIFIYIKEIR